MDIEDVFDCLYEDSACFIQDYQNMFGDSIDGNGCGNNYVRRSKEDYQHNHIFGYNYTPEYNEIKYSNW